MTRRFTYLRKFLAALILFCGVMSSQHSAAQTSFTVDGIKYSAGTGTAKVTGFTSTITTLNISNVTYNGITYTVTSIGSGAFSNCTSLTSVEFPEVTYIENSAFANCSNLTDAKFPKVEVIGYQSFYNSKIKTVDYPALRVIGEEAFRNCIYLGTNVSFSKVTTIEKGAFSGCTNIAYLTIPGVTTLPEFAFQTCTKLRTATFSDVTTIEKSAFAQCEKLQSANFPKLETIGEYAFYRCFALPSASFDNATNIGNHAFEECNTLATATFPKVTSVGEEAFRSCPKLANGSFPEATSIGKWAFLRCSALKSLTLGSTVPTVGEDAFLYCPSPRYLTVPTVAINDYKTDGNGGYPTEKLWYGWTLDYTVTFDTDGGTPVPSVQTVSPGNTATRPTIDPTKTDYDFDDWYSDANKTTKFNFSGIITSDTTIYAKWNLKQYTITITSPTNGTVTTNPASNAIKGETVKINTVSDVGYEVDEIKVYETATPTKQVTPTITTDTTFTMPAANVTVNITFKKTSYTVTVNTPTNGSAAADKPIANMGDDITVTPTPDTGYEVDAITYTPDGGTATAVPLDAGSNTYKFTMPAANVTIDVTFKKTSYTVTVNTPTNGSAAADKPTANMGDDITVTPTPDTGYEVDAITYTPDGGTATAVPLDAGSNTYKFTMPAANVTVDVTFKKTSYTVAVNWTPTEGGTTVTASKSTANMDDEITITATPSEGYQIKEITYTPNGGSSTDITLTQKFTMPATNVIVDVTFELIDYTVTVNTDGFGTATPSKSTANKGDNITLTVTPNSSYELDKIEYTLVGSTTPIDITAAKNFTMPAANVTVSVTFKALPPATYAITVHTDGNGSATSASAGATISSAIAGTSIDINTAPKTGYEIDKITYKADNGTITETDITAAKNFSMPASNVTVDVIFKASDYNVTVRPTTNGTASADKPLAKMGETVTIKAVPDAGYEVDGIKVYETTTPTNQVTVAIATDTTFTMPAADVTVDVTFKPATYTVTFNINGHGTAPTSIKNAAWNNTITEPTAPTARGWDFGGWFKEAACINAWDFASDVVTSNITLYAKWTSVVLPPVTYTVTFDENGHGTAPAPITGVTSGSLISAPITPSETDYKFSGWFTDADCTNAWDFTKDVVTSDTTLYAKWSEMYTITLIATGNGAASVSATKAFPGTEISVSAKPASGYEIYYIIYTPENGAARNMMGVGKFTMPEANVVVTVSFMETPPEILRHNVTLLDFKGGKFNPGPGNYWVVNGYNFEFRLTPLVGYTFHEQPTVMTDNKDYNKRIEYTPIYIEDMLIAYDIRVSEIRRPLTIWVVSGLSPVTNEEVAPTRVWANAQTLYVHAADASARLQVYNLTGKMVVDKDVPAGQSTVTGLPRGIYVVRIGNVTQKVIIK